MKLKKWAAMAGIVMAMVGHARADTVTLNYWSSWTPGTPEETKSMDRIRSYEKSHPGVKINVQVITFGMLHDKLVTSVTGGDAPDVSWGLSEWFGELRQMGALLDLSPYADKWPDRANIRPNVLASLTVDGKLLALPQYIGLRALVYHDDMLKKAGYNAPPATWNDMLGMAAKVKAATGKYAFGIAGTGVRAPQELIAFLAQNDVLIARPQTDGKYKNTWQTDPAEMQRAVEVFTFYKDMLDKGLIAPDAASWGWQEEDTNFALGQYAMVVDGPWMQNLATQNGATMQDAKVAPPPYKLKPTTFFEVSPLYIFKGSKHPEEAWKFASYILSKEWQEDIRPDNSPRADVLGHAQWGKGFTDLAPTGVVFPPVALGQISKNMTDAVGRVLIRKDQPKEVAAWLAKAINQDLRKSGQLSSK